MAKSQGKKKPAAPKAKAARKPVATKKLAAKKPAAKKAATKPSKAAAKPAPKASPRTAAVKKTAAKKQAAKQPAKGKPAKATAKPAKAAKPVKAPKPVKSAVREAPAAKVKTAPAAVPAPARKPAPAPAAAAAAGKKPRARRARPRIHSDGTPLAAWLTPGEKPRPSSFIPAPPRAEGPSLIAAAPASSDRLIRPEDVAEAAVRTVPVRVDIEQSAGRVYISVNPQQVMLRVGEGVEWDFRFLGGADVSAEEITIEFDRPSPFTQTTFKSRKPGVGRPYRQLSGAALKTASGKRARYTIRVVNQFKTELAMAEVALVVA